MLHADCSHDPIQLKYSKTDHIPSENYELSLPAAVIQ